MKSFDRDLSRAFLLSLNGDGFPDIVVANRHLRGLPRFLPERGLPG